MDGDSERGYRAGYLVLAMSIVFFTCVLALTYSWVNMVAGRYGASVPVTLQRVHSNKLIVQFPQDAAAPWNAPTEEMMYVSYGDVPPIMRNAVLSSEDYWFFYHFGINPVAFVKAVASQFGDDPRGGSTITQQLAKQLYVGDRRDVWRKIDELAMAFWLEWHFSKKQLLEFYFNTPFMGHGTKGLEAAARYYFGYSFKKAGRWQPVTLTPDMAASLAVTIKNPTSGNPMKVANLKEARRLLLSMNVEPQNLTAQASADASFPKRFAPQAFADAAHLSDQFSSARDLAVARLSDEFGKQHRSLDVTTFYSSEMQLYLERAIDIFYPRLRRAGYDQLTAVVVDNRSGGVKAIVAPPGARIYPGSTVKPLAALCAIVHHGWNGRTRLSDTPVGEPPVRNADRKYLGAISLEETLMKSRNPPFVRMMAEFGPDCANDILKRMRSSFRFEGSSDREMALGAAPVGLMDLLNAYVTLASCGHVANAPLLIEEVRDRRTQKVVMRQHADALPLEADLVGGFDTLHAILSKVSGPGGTANGSRFVRDVAAKTGTSDDNRQITLITFTRAYTVLVSVGASQLDQLKQHLSSAALVPLVKNLNANIHPDGYHDILGCDVPLAVPVPTFVADRGVTRLR